MTFRNKSLGIDSEGYKDVMNVKINPSDIHDLLQVPGILPAYHLNKKHWVTILLDDSLNYKAIRMLVKYSYSVTKLRKKYDI